MKMKKGHLTLLLCCALATCMTMPLHADDDELLVSYSFNNNGDDSGTYAATLYGSASFVTLEDGNRVLSTGNNQGYLDLGQQMARNVLGQLTGDYSISLDINVGVPNSLNSYCWAWAMGNGTDKYTALVNKSGGGDWYYEIKNSTAYMAHSNKTLREEEWHTITAVQSGSTCAIYVDGEQKGTVSTTLHPSGFAASITQSWLGRSPYSGDAYMTNTMMDNFRIYKKALTAAEVQALFEARPQQQAEDEVTFPLIYNFSTLQDNEGQFTGSLKNGASLTTFGSKPVLSLGSSDGYFDFGEEFGKAVGKLDKTFSISTTLYVPKSTSVSGAGNFIWCFARSSSQGYLFLSAKDTRYSISTSNWSGETNVNASTPIAQGEWINVTYVQNSNTGSLYVNGQRKAQNSNMSTHPADLNRLLMNYLGKSCYDGDAYLKDALYADFSIYNTAISSDELAELTANAQSYNDIGNQGFISMDLNALTLPSSINNLYEGVTLPTKGAFGSTITWQSDNTALLSNAGKVVGTPEGTRQHVTLTATLTNGDATATKTFDVYVHEKDNPYSRYLFTFFPSNSDENIYYAVSDDGYNYTVVNQNKPVVYAEGNTVMNGLRDPHILRGEDGRFYMVATDMRCALGWSSNRGMVLMRSDDLVNWTCSTVHFPTRYAGTYFANVTRVWAPETIYDPVAGKYLIYFSILTNDGVVPYDKVFYAYANEDFTDLEGEPIYFYDRGSATIDMDIVFNENDGLYHGFYKNEGSGGICQVTATSLTAPAGEEGSQWSEPSGTLQQTTEAVEGAGVFRLINSDDWILMYDCYNNGHYQFCSSQDLFQFTFRKNTTTSGAFTPRHGTVIPITEEEYRRLPGVPNIDVPISSAGYATLYYANADLKIPEGVQAFTGVVNGEWLKLTELTGKIPAGTAVVLKGEEGTYRFTTTTGAAAVSENDLRGSNVDVDAAGKYVLALPEGEPVGFYLAEEGTIKAGTAYLEVTTGVKTIYLEDGDATGVGAVPSSEVKGSAYHKVLTPKGILLAPQNEDGKSEGACFDIIGRQVAK